MGWGVQSEVPTRGYEVRVRKLSGRVPDLGYSGMVRCSITGPFPVQRKFMPVGRGQIRCHTECILYVSGFVILISLKPSSTADVL